MGKSKVIQIIIWPFRFIYNNIRMWLLLLKGFLPHPYVGKGEKFIVLKDIQTQLLIHMNAPATESIQCVVPKGTRLITFSEPVKLSSVFSCIALNSEEFENNFIPESILQNPKYAGYSFPINYKDIGKTVKKIKD